MKIPLRLSNMNGKIRRRLGGLLSLVCAVGLTLALAGAAPAANILLVGGQLAPDNDLRQLLSSFGHTVSPLSGTFAAAPPTAAQLTGIDLILVSRSSNSGDYDDAITEPVVGNEPALWNQIAKPMIVLNNALIRGGAGTVGNRRWGFVDSVTGVDNQPAPTDFNAYTNAAHPFVSGLSTSVFPGGSRMDYINTQAIPAGATTVATMTQGANTFAALIDIPAGTTLFLDPQEAMTVTGGRRVFMQMPDYPDTTDVFTISKNGAAILNKIITTISTPGTAVLGDVSGNGTVGPEDFTPIRTNFRMEVSSRTQGDLTGDGIVDYRDFLQWKTAFVGGGGSLAGFDLSSVPEPSSMLLLSLGLVGLLGGRGRSRRAS